MPGTPWNVAVRFDEPLRLFLRRRSTAGRRRPEASREFAADGTSSLGHLVQACGVPLTEVGSLRRNGCPAGVGEIPASGDVVDVAAMPRPQQLLMRPLRVVLDVHLGTLARRLRLLGIDTAYRNEADDPELVRQAIEEQRLLLTQDRGLLMRRALPVGAFVRGTDPDEQLGDVLDRFRPELAPYSRCVACNGPLVDVEKAEAAAAVPAGTRRTARAFRRCTVCRRIYWQGAHAGQLEAIVKRARRQLEEG